VKSIGKKSGTANVIRYVLKPEKINGKTNTPVIVRRNIRGKTEKAYIREFELNEKQRQNKRTNMNVSVHTILSFKGDATKVTPQVIRDISSKYMSLKGHGNLYLAVAHFNNPEQIHIHIIESATNLKGQTARISRGDFFLLKKELSLYQERRFPELSNSLPEHGKKAKQLPIVAKPYISPRTISEKDAIAMCLDRQFSKAHSVKEFVKGIRDSGYEVYMRNDRPQGVLCNGLKHRFSKFGYTQEKFSELGIIETKEAKLMKEFEAIRSKNTLAKEEQELENEQDLEREVGEYTLEEQEKDTEDLIQEDKTDEYSDTDFEEEPN